MVQEITRRDFLLKSILASGALLPFSAFANETPKEKSRKSIIEIIEHGENFSNLYLDEGCEKQAFDEIYPSAKSISRVIKKPCFYKSLSCELDIPFEISQLFFTNDPAYALPLATKVSEKISKMNGKKGYDLTLKKTLWRKTENGAKEVGHVYFGTDNRNTYGRLDIVYLDKYNMLSYSPGTFKGFPAETVNFVKFSNLEKKTGINFDLFVWPQMEKSGWLGKITSTLLGEDNSNKIAARYIDSKIDETKLKEKILEIFLVAQDTSNFILNNPQILSQPEIADNKEELNYLQQILAFAHKRQK